jgi:hypothetical protein
MRTPFFLGHMRVADSSTIIRKGKNGTITIPTTEGNVFASVVRNSIKSPGSDITAEFSDGKIVHGASKCGREVTKRARKDKDFLTPFTTGSIG